MDKKLDKVSKTPDLTRLSSLLQIRERVRGGVPIAKACREAGYPRASYYIDIKKLEAQESAA